jgi:ABC-type hemin transport system substrate-binding protein
LVRFETGSSRLTVLASQTVVMANGSAAIYALGTSASITGVSHTAVVPRLSNIVVREAKTHTE